MITFELPIRTVSEGNAREHWASRHRRRAKQRGAARLTGQARGLSGIAGPVTVRLTRLSPRQLDSDNLPASIKAVRDGLADALGRDDGPSSGITWEYAWERSKTCAVRVEVWT